MGVNQFLCRRQIIRPTAKSIGDTLVENNKGVTTGPARIIGLGEASLVREALAMQIDENHGLGPKVWLNG